MIEAILNDYRNRLNEALSQVSPEDVNRVVGILYEAYRTGRQVLIAGNGGSAATASHFACDLANSSRINGQPQLRAFSLNDNASMMTALANDYGYDQVFVAQVRALLQPGDVLIVITGSGNSKNVLKALEYANEIEAVTIGLLGFGGGKARRLCRTHITLDHDTYGPVEDVHLILAHAISECLKAILLAQSTGMTEARTKGRLTAMGGYSGTPT